MTEPRELPADHRSAPTAFDVVAMVASLGGLRAYSKVLSALPADFPAAVLLVQHRDPRYAGLLPELLGRRTELRVRAAAHGDRLRPGTVYVAPVDRQLLLAPDRTLALCPASTGRIPRPRCQADPLFASVAAQAGERAIAVVLTGALDDGAAGVRAIKRLGGRVLAQDRDTSEAFGQPAAARATGCVDWVLPLEKIAGALVSLVMAPGVVVY